MTFSKQTNQVRISNQSSPRNSTIDTFLIHHQAGTNDDAVIDAMVSGSRGVSANYTISNEGRITCVVPEERRAWTSGSAYDGGKGAAWDHRSVTVEIENESAGGAWPISSKALNAAARLLSDLRSRYTIKNVLGHRDLWDRYNASYPTFCPGPETVAKIVALAGSSLAGSGTPIPLPAPKPEKEEDMQPTNYVNKATMPGGKFAEGSQCITLWPSGAVQHYELTNQPRNEQIAYIMYDLFGAHKSLEKQVFDSIVAAHAALQGATTGGDGTYNGDGFASVIAKISELPTAIENGNAARAAIVKE
jgi:hypothetical protein